MKLMFFMFLPCYPMVSSVELFYVALSDNSSVIKINDTRNERPSYKLVEDEDSLQVIPAIENTDDNDGGNFVAITYIDPDGRMNCTIVNS